MTTRSIRATLATLLAATATAAMLAASPALAAPAAAPKGPSVSGPVGKLLMAAQTAMGAKDFKTALDDVNQAKALKDRTPYDDYEIAHFEMIIDVNSGDTNAALVPAQTAAASPAMPEEDKAGILKIAIILSNQAKQFDKSKVYAKQAETLNSDDAGLQTAIAQAYYFGGDQASAQAYVQKLVDAAKAAGKKPDHAMLQILLGAQIAQKDEAGAENTLEVLVANYNQPDDWQQSIDTALGSKGLRDLDIVWLGRLLLLCGATVSSGDSSVIGQTASHLTFYGDTLAAQQHGGTGFPDATAKATADKKTINQQIAAGAKQGGQYNIKLAEALYGYGMYPEAETAAKLALSKGGITDSSEGPMVLGQAQAAQGKYDDALASFAKVTGGGPVTARVTRLWTDYVSIKKSPPAATASAQ